MGGGGTISEGIRRLFQRRSTSSKQHNNELLVKDLRSQLAVIPTTNDHDHDQPQQSLFNLNHIKVPTNTVFFPSSMDPNKKVPNPTFFIFLSFFIGFDPFLFLLSRVFQKLSFSPSMERQVNTRSKKSLEKEVMVLFALQFTLTLVKKLQSRKLTMFSSMYLMPRGS